ncbi:adenylate/guanylate cyclase domain-containing protein [Desulfofustis glycolicus]|uniref:Adenylate cyclase, class 3 n=1 Tax=Desulfofustis glycolicus DSM 9705 TaxID=1121409 RepID=A0A1M5WE89_9BACT|nr:adenylate/guanylate cyclase domain-containing protein [Desulfofustis glycolicus]MCB2217048.1 adenylate/guanylate cyclase domain-containing protein [Desulfobulbaceae bacterium]SHH85812.1 Adenylate cyclase, class 3 [Desulfofustis glycolicus DSM 9705]
MMTMRLKYTKYSQLKIFLIVSFLVGATLCVVQSAHIFTPFDMALFRMDSLEGYQPIPLSVTVLIIMFHTLFPGIIILEEGVVKGMIYTVIAWFFYAVLIHSYSTAFHLFMPVSAPLIGTLAAIIRVLAWGSTVLEEEKNDIRNTFGHFVEPSIATLAIENPGLLKEDGVLKTVTVMFADLRGFTKLCRDIEPEQVIKMMRECFGKLISIARANDGVIDKLIGDSLMVVWGNPVERPDHAERAVEAALEMQAMMRNLRHRWQTRMGVKIDLGIGINTDQVVVGTIGSEEYCDYTVLGYGVNIASRIERGCPGGEICVSKKTMELLGGLYRCEAMGRFEYKNVRDKIEVFRVLQDRDQGENT